MSSNPYILGHYSSSKLFLIKAISNLHPGVGRAGDVVDLAVQRDSLGYPIIYSSSLKGAMKSSFWHVCSSDAQQKDECIKKVKELFGSEPEDEEKFMSKLAVLDAILVSFPVRSLEGVYAYATSPLMLNRLRNYVDLAGGEAVYQALCNGLKKALEFMNQTKDVECIASSKALETLGIKNWDSKRLIINEEIVTCNTGNEASKMNLDHHMESLGKALDMEPERLLVLNDNIAKDLLERSIVRVTRVALERSLKKVKRGALWTEEYIPMGTVFATVILYAGSTETKFDELVERLGFYLIIGGKETVGRGIVKLRRVDGGRDGGSVQTQPR